jgi:PTH1 family peptidyl-tRNA hydrolase
MLNIFGRRKNEESVMKLVVGLGNPTARYDKTRHNVGFEVIDALADKYNIALDTMKHKGMYGKGKIDGQSVILLKPMTFMNLSGESVALVSGYYKVAPEDIIVIYDDINLDVGRLRIREKGSAGGHNGMKNIIAHLGTEEFPRLRIGVGMKPPKMDLADYVLSHFSEEEQALMNQGYDKACEALKLLLLDDIPQAMNQYNGK